MSEFKEKVLSEISFAMVDDAPDLQKLYDKVAATDENSEFNDNQKIVLEWLKEQVSIGSGLQYVLWEFTDNVYEDPAEYSVSEQTKAWLELTEQEQFQVLSAFAQWGLEQEEVG